MEETLKLILNKLDTMGKDIQELKEGQSKLAEKETDHFNQVINEIQYVFTDLDKRITALEAKV